MLGMDSETEQRWAARVAEWKASGLTSTRYCEGRDFTPGGLRHWAYRLRKTAARTAAIGHASSAAPRRAYRQRKGAAKTELVRQPTVQIVRVERVSEVRAAGRAPTAVPLKIRLGAARLAVPAGFDGATLRTVLDVLMASVGRWS
jgi:hypothetical protein